MDSKVQDLIAFFETKDQELDRKIRAEKFLKKIQMKPRPGTLTNSEVRIGRNGTEFMQNLDTFVPEDIIDLVKREITCRKVEPQSEIFNRMKEKVMMRKQSIVETDDLLGPNADLDCTVEGEKPSSIVNQLRVIQNLA